MNLDANVTSIDSIEDLFNRMSNAVSFYHALELFVNSKHLVMTTVQRVDLVKRANCRLKQLHINGIKIADESDPYKNVFYSHYDCIKKVEARGVEPLSL
jgi:hypothetical protein